MLFCSFQLTILDVSLIRFQDLAEQILKYWLWNQLSGTEWLIQMFKTMIHTYMVIYTI